MLEKVRFIDS